MKIASSFMALLLVADKASAFVPQIPMHHSKTRSSSRQYMAVDMPPAPDQSSSNLPVVQANPYGQPTEIRYSDFLKLVNADRIEKVTFSADGTQLLGVDADGVRVAIEALPNDPDLLTQLTNHKVSILRTKKMSAACPSRFNAHKDPP